MPQPRLRNAPDTQVETCKRNMQPQRGEGENPDRMKHPAFTPQNDEAKMKSPCESPPSNPRPE